MWLRWNWYLTPRCRRGRMILSMSQAQAASSLTTEARTWRNHDPQEAISCSRTAMLPGVRSSRCFTATTSVRATFAIGFESGRIRGDPLRAGGHANQVKIGLLMGDFIFDLKGGQFHADAYSQFPTITG